MIPVRNGARVSNKCLWRWTVDENFMRCTYTSNDILLESLSKRGKLETRKGSSTLQHAIAETKRRLPLATDCISIVIEIVQKTNEPQIRFALDQPS